MNAALLHPRLLPLLLLALLALLGVGCQQPQTTPDVVTMVVESSSPFVVAAEDDELALTLDVAAQPPQNLERKALNLSLVIDHSGSMTGEQMADARLALHTLLGKLDDDDFVSVIAFGSQVELLQEQTEWGDADQSELLAAVDAITPRGTTAMGDALGVALGQVASTWDASRVNRVILLTDGMPNDPNQVLQLGAQARNQQIALSTMGLGPQFNETLMAQLADMTGGQYRFIASSDQIAATFDEQRASLEKTVARSAVLTFTFGPGVQLTQIYGAPQANVYGQRVDLYLGDMDAQTHRKLGLRLKVAGQPEGARVEIADAVLRYEDVATGAQRERLVYVEAEASSDRQQVEARRRQDVIKRLEQFGALQDMEGAIQQWERGELDDARRSMNDAAARYKANRLTLGGEASGSGAVAPNPAAAPLAADLPANPAAEEANVEAYIEAQIDNIDKLDPASPAGKLVGKETRAVHRNSLGY